MATLYIPAAFQFCTDQQNSINVPAMTVAECLHYLCQTYPALSSYCWDSQGKLRAFINVYVNHQDIRYLQQEQTPLIETDVVHILPSIAGG